jgi:hypothetical protein
MSSLIYVTRIKPPSPAVTQALESSGFHVKSFGPGEITADECILVMSSEAALAGLRAMGMASGAAMGAQSHAAPSLQDIPKHLGVDAAIWNCIKAAESGATAVVEPTRLSSPASSVSAVVRATENLGFVASQAGARALAASQKKASPPLLLSEPKSAPGGDQKLSVPHPSLSWLQNRITETTRNSILLWKRTTSQETRSSASSRHSRFMQPVALAATLLIVAILLLAGRASLFPSTSGVAAIASGSPRARSGSSVADLIRKASGAESSNRPSNMSADGRRHISDYDFVAEDYTTRFDPHSRPVASSPTPGSRPEAQKRLVRKRVVFN